MSKLNIVSVNAMGLNTKEKRIKFYSWLKDSKIDIAFLQETHYMKKKRKHITAYGPVNLFIVSLILLTEEVYQYF